MSLFDRLFRRRMPVAPVFDPNPGEIDWMPARPYRVVHSDLPFYSDPECRIEVPGARLIVLECADSSQAHKPIECMPTLKRYRAGQLVQWDLSSKRQWETAWYINPDTGQKEKAWSRSVEFMGKVAATQDETTPPISQAGSSVSSSDQRTTRAKL